jgi:HEAT repeat protein/putative zinc finger protein
MTNKTNCEEMRGQFALMLYGELSFDEEERVESHLDGCAECRRALEHQRSLHAAVDAVAVTPSPALLNACREDLIARLDREASPSGIAAWWHSLATGWNIQFLRPAGAMALLALGFFAAKVTPGLNFGSAYQAGVGDFGGAQVRNVTAQPDGTLRIVVDENRQRMLSGNLGDQQIRSLLMSTAKEAPDAGLRARTVAILMSNAGDQDVRQTLVFSLRNDASPDVRLRALEGLKGFGDDPEVQGALARVLLSDSNAGMRTKVVEALTSRESQRVDRQIVGALQELMTREDDDYVREQTQRILRSIKASSEIY